MENGQKKVLCIQDLSCVGRCSMTVALQVFGAMGIQAVPLPTQLLSTHTGGLGRPAVLDGMEFCLAALRHWKTLGMEFDCIYAGYLGGTAQAGLVRQAFALWPDSYKVVDPVMGDHGVLYSAITPEVCGEIAALCRSADLILPNLTEACRLLGVEMPQNEPDGETALALAARLSELGPAVVITGIPMEKYLCCAGGGRESFLIKKLAEPRSFPGTGDLFASVLVGCLVRGNALSAAADAGAEFVKLAIRATPAKADPRHGVWFEKELRRLTE